MSCNGYAGCSSPARVIVTIGPSRVEVPIVTITTTLRFETMKTIVRFLDFCSDFTNEHFDRLVTAGIILLLVMAASVPLVLLLGPVNPVITVETPYGIATISGPGAEYVLHSAFPIKH